MSVEWDLIPLLAKMLVWIGKTFLVYSSTIFIFAIPATIQEYKIWRTTPTPLNLWGIFKVYLYNIIWMVLCILGFVLLLPMWISRGCGRSVELEAHCVMERLTAFALTSMVIGTVEVREETTHENDSSNDTKDQVSSVPSPSHSKVAPIFIANHSSQIDVGVVYYAIPHFKWIAKKSVQFIPGPGNLMSLAGHIFIQRTGRNSKSVSSLYEQSDKSLQDGIPLMIFPQGTRRITQMLPFKDGAFNIAIQNEAMLVPISIEIPMGVWNNLYPLSKIWGGEGNTILMTIHKPVQVTKDMKKEDLKLQCNEIIYSALPKVYGGKKDKIS